MVYHPKAVIPEVGVLEMALKPLNNEEAPILRVVRRRSKHFGKHGERFDRRLFAEVDSCVRIWLELRSKAVIGRDREDFKRIVIIRESLLNRGKQLYYDFP